MKTTKQNLAVITRKRKKKVFEAKTKAEIIPLAIASANNSQMTKKCALSKLYIKNEPCTSTSSKNDTIHVPDKEFPVVSKTLDRYGISDRAGAAIVFSLQDIGLISGNNLSNVVDISKIRRARQKERSILTP